MSAARTAIEWTTRTWNPTRGCARVSEGCRHCYAEAMAGRFAGKGLPYEGLVKRIGDEWRWTGKVRLVPEALAEPLRWRSPVTCFVDSMSDLFHDDVPDDYIAAVFGVMAACRHITFQILTKRPERMKKWFAWLEAESDSQGDEWAGRECGVSVHDARDACRMEMLDEAACDALAGHVDACHLGLTTSKVLWPLPNVWLGVSVEDDHTAHQRIPRLLEAPAAVHWISYEPALGPLDLAPWMPKRMPHDVTGKMTAWIFEGAERGIDWVVAGCESGKGARPAFVSWYRAVRDVCAANGVPFFLKQATTNDQRPDGVDGPLITLGSGSRAKKGKGMISLPYLDGVQHIAMPRGR